MTRFINANNTILKNIKRVKYCTCYLTICLALICSSGRSQDNVNDITALFSQYHQNSIKEKIFVHTDKSFYVAGEILWFKLYIVDASAHLPLQLSKVAYVEILDSTNKNVVQAKIFLNDGEGNGSFYLPLNLSSGNFKLRAYTNWMKNFSADYFFEKNITIVNVQKKIDVPVLKTAPGIDIRFFPEGGNMVNNISCKMAFKGNDEYGKAINFKGFLIDNGDTLLSFNPRHAGMGVFSFTPVANHSYKAFIQTESGQKIISELPVAYNSGYVMHVADSAGKIVVSVQSDILYGQQIYLLAHTREMIKIAANSALQNGKASFVFDREKLGDGISQITIFNEQKQPVCERLYFKKPAAQLDVTIHADQSIYATRKKISLSIDVANNNIKNDTASLSMTVFKLDSLQPSKPAAISSYLLLTSDLPGYLDDPDYYFLNDDEETNADLDNVMLTHGWRRFKWEEILENKKPYFEFVPEYKNQIIVGKVINTITGKPASNIESYISIPGLQTGFNTSTSDEDGNVKFEMKNFYGSSEIILQTNTAKDSTYRVDVTDPFSNSFSHTLFPAFTLRPSIENSLRQQSISMQVQNIYSGKKLKQFVAPNFDTTSFYLHPDVKYLLDDYTRFSTLEEVLREYVALADVRKREGNFHFELYDFASNLMFKNDPLVMLDGVPVFDFNKFMELDPLLLYKVEVFNKRYFLGASVFNGVLNWTSYKNDLAGFDPSAHATIIDYDGLQTEREFYAPKYETEEQRSGHLPDFRNVLQWNPHIKIAPGSRKEISFYSSDITGKYLVEIEGISKNGMCGNKIFTFEVK